MMENLDVISSLEEVESTQALAGFPGDSLTAEVALSFRDGIECLNRGEPGEAARYFEDVLARAPKFADGHVGLGIAYAVEAKVYPAIDHLEEAARLAPDNFYAHFKLGQLYFKLRVPQKGFEGMRLALRCASTPGERRLVAQLLREEKQREKSAYRRPWWNKPFSQMALLVGASLMVVLIAALFAHLR
jgi:tetratricopeptide (TPR) repeat protein